MRDARSRSPAKDADRPTIKPLSLSDIQLSSARLSSGPKSGIELPQYDGLQRFSIELRDSWLEMPYGLDRGYLGQEPSFITEGGAQLLPHHRRAHQCGTGSGLLSTGR